MMTAVRLSRKTFYNYNLYYVVKGQISDIYCTFLLFFSKGTHQTQVLKSKGFCVISRAHTGTTDLVVWSGDASSENTSSLLPKLHTPFSLLMQIRSISEERAQG